MSERKKSGVHKVQILCLSVWQLPQGLPGSEIRQCGECGGSVWLSARHVESKTTSQLICDACVIASTDNQLELRVDDAAVDSVSKRLGRPCTREELLNIARDELVEGMMSRKRRS